MDTSVGHAEMAWSRVSSGQCLLRQAHNLRMVSKLKQKGRTAIPQVQGGRKLRSGRKVRAHAAHGGSAISFSICFATVTRGNLGIWTVGYACKMVSHGAGPPA